MVDKKLLLQILKKKLEEKYRHIQKCFQGEQKSLKIKFNFLKKKSLWSRFYKGPVNSNSGIESQISES